MGEDKSDDFGTWSGNSSLGEEPRVIKGAGMTRRDFLKVVAKGSAAAAASSVRGASQLGDFAQSVDARRQSEDARIPEGLPDDIISEEELENRFNIKKYDLPREQFPNDFVELHIRASAAEDPLFQRLESGRLKGLNVFLVDHQSIDPSKFTPEQREAMDRDPFILAGLERQLERVKQMNTDEIEDNRSRMREEYNEKYAELSSRRDQTSDDRFKVEEQALAYTYGRYLRDEPTLEDLSELSMVGYAPMNGTGTNHRGEQGPVSYIFLAVRDKEPTVTFASGNESKTISSSRIPYGEQNGQRAPHPSQSYPDGSQLTILEEPNEHGYLIVGGRGPGDTFIHESTHARGVLDEPGADRATIERIMSAAQHMRETESDEKYWLVFETPEGVTITQDQRDEVSV